eukprot:5140000-Amphidinium_carterae.2
MPLAAPVSKTPGRTRHLFRFEVGGCLTFVDLPGYGFAKVKADVRASWSGLVSQYLSDSPHLERVIHLVDAAVGVKRSDEDLWNMLQREGLQVMVVLTKVDRTPPEGLNRTMAHVVSALQLMKEECTWPYVHAVSGLHGHGITELRAALSAIASDYQARQRAERAAGKVRVRCVRERLARVYQQVAAPLPKVARVITVHQSYGIR